MEVSWRGKWNDLKEMWKGVNRGVRPFTKNVGATSKFKVAEG
jgi:hypothetical protein